MTVWVYVTGSLDLTLYTTNTFTHSWHTYMNAVEFRKRHDISLELYKIHWFNSMGRTGGLNHRRNPSFPGTRALSRLTQYHIVQMVKSFAEL